MADGDSIQSLVFSLTHAHWRVLSKCNVFRSCGNLCLNRLLGLILCLIGPPLFVGLDSTAAHAQVVLESREGSSGTVQSIRPGVLRLVDDQGQSLELKYQSPGERGVSLAGAEAIIDFPAKIIVRGRLPAEQLEAGQVIALDVKLLRGGRVLGEAQDLRFAATDEAASVEPVGEPDESGATLCRVVGSVISVRNNRLALQTVRSPLTSRDRLAIPITDDTQVSFELEDLERVQAGDRVVGVRFARFSTGDSVIESIEIERQAATASTLADDLETQFRDYSDEPSEPRDVRSQHFLLHTDISDRQAQILLFKLERMIDLVSRYFGRPASKMIECYVVSDLDQWPPGALEPQGAAKIAAMEGVTISQSLGRETRSIVYSCARHGVVQHEAMHAYCAQTFGSTGPTWYSEGVAEMGQYWKEGELAVNIDPVVADFLAKANPKKALLEIVEADQITGDSWQNYAWRWALCHLLANNPNYNQQFRGLGISMMSGQPDTFESAYGNVAPQISFEYDQFVKHVANGYRVDLCAWQWDKRSMPLRGSRKAKVDIRAAYGWQASGVEVEAGTTIRVQCDGTWKVDGLTQGCTADGEASGEGRLLGVVMTDFVLSEPFELGADMTFTAPASGILYLRCQDEWVALADNDGSIEVTMSLEP